MKTRMSIAAVVAASVLAITSQVAVAQIQPSAQVQNLNATQQMGIDKNNLNKKNLTVALKIPKRPTGGTGTSTTPTPGSCGLLGCF